jgi:hypothetical protein
MARKYENLGKAIKFTARTVDKTATGLGRWATTDHSGMGKALANMPSTGFLDSVRYILTQLLITVVGAVLMGIWVFLLVGYGAN